MSVTIASRALGAVRAGLVLSVAFAAGLGGCVAKPVPQPEAAPEPQAVIATMDTGAAYAEGLHAFWNGDYKRAAEVFDTLLRREEDQAFRSQALYGLACARLAAADAPEELRKARELWMEWERSTAGDGVRVDPHMLTPFVKNVKIGQYARDQRPPAAPAPAASKAADPDCLKRLQDKEREVGNLQKQIKALEAIHREIQEKKRMSAP